MKRANRRTRGNAISYAESEASDHPPSQNPDHSDRDFDSESEEDELTRTDSDAALSSHVMDMRTRARPVPATMRQYRNAVGKRGKPKNAHTTIRSDRRAVRDQIHQVTVANRDRFFIEHREYFLPLLPANNYISRLIKNQNDGKSDEEMGKADVSDLTNNPEDATPAKSSIIPGIVPYKQIENQPKGIIATMKPYQLSGLSFMVYLYKNGVSGILGDEMGLGKTLQTLSLVQYLKENASDNNRESRPFLIICPLSVLSSWMSEAKKWVPGLKMLRFQGPLKERDRLKKIATGELDHHGNETRKHKNKVNARRKASGKGFGDLEDDEAGEEESPVDVVVTTYESYLAEQTWFKRAFAWRYVVLDEGHKIKNEQSLISKSLQGLQAEYRLILTGTPLQNNLGELWALLHWLYPDVFSPKTGELFKTSFDLTKGLYSHTVLDASRTLLELIMLRRMKNSQGVDLNLPPKTEVLLFVPLSPMQRFWYKRMITRMDQGLLEDLFQGAKDKVIGSGKQDEVSVKLETDRALLDYVGKQIDGLENSEDVDAFDETREILENTIARENSAEAAESSTSAWKKLYNLLMQLRKVCNHPFQIKAAIPEPYNIDEYIITASGKFMVLDKLIRELVINQRKKILIFSCFTQMLDLVEDLLALRGGDGTHFRYARLDGSTPRARRNLGIRLFNKLDSDHRVMLISTRAGGLGVNLATASDVVLLDQDWNPQITLQAEARAHRMGQKNPVTVYKFVSQGTVEEQMLGRIQKKLYLSAKVTESMQDIHTPAGTGRGRKGKKSRGSVKPEDDMPQMSTGQLMTLVRRGTSAISRTEIDVKEMLSWDWDTTVAKCKDQPADVNVKRAALPDVAMDTDAEQERKWLSEMERVESHVFEGKKLARGAKTSSNADIAREWNRADRRIGKNTTVMVDGFAINKATMACNEWEAVPTMARKDPRLAEPKREKRKSINNQDHCQVCFDGGDLHLCELCPRSYHMGCLDREFQAKTKGMMFSCPQHQCYVCEQKTTDAGGMLLRCRWCERAYCEDDLDWDATVLIGETLKEYEILGFGQKDQAYYISCPSCEAGEDKSLMETMERDIDAEYRRFTEYAPSQTGSVDMTDATTLNTTGASTPLPISSTGAITDDKRKRDGGADEEEVEREVKRVKSEIIDLT